MSNYNKENITSFQDLMLKLYSNEITEVKKNTNALYNESDFMVKDITIQVTENCNFACSYCYQHNKTTHAMSYETAKQVIDNCINDPDISNKLGIIFELPFP